GNSTDVQADIPFARWRGIDIPFETEAFPSKAIKRTVAAKQTAGEGAKQPAADPNSPGSKPTKPDGVLHSVTAGGIAASHIDVPQATVLAAPNASKEFNRIKRRIVPLACWRAQDVRFAFESSFVRPEISTEIAALNELIVRHTLTDENGRPTQKPPLTVF